MKKTYKTPCKGTFLAVAIPPAVITALLAFTHKGITISKVGWDEAFFPHQPPLEFALTFLVGFPILWALLGGVVVLYYKRGTITLTDYEITGRDFWGLKQTIPLIDITGLYEYRYKGFHALVVQSPQHGEIFVHTNVEGFEELAGVLTRNFPKENLPPFLLKAPTNKQK